MSWKLQQSLDRIEAHLNVMGTIEVKDLVREADLKELLTPTRCRNIQGTHIYFDVANFTAIASKDEDGEDYKRVIQGTHLYHREVAHIVKAVMDITRVHFQGPKLHALCYRPIRDDEELAARAVLLLLVLKDFVGSVFNPAFPKLGNFSVAGGTDLGQTIGTKNGANKDRELLFLGAAANYAAKILGGAGTLRLNEDVYDALPADLQDICDYDSNGVYQVQSLTRCKLDELLEDHDIEWDRDASAGRINEDKKRYPLCAIGYSGADTLIDLDSLGITNNKRVLAASIFADVSGFTRYIDAAQTLDEEAKALRVFHAIRRETAHVVREDYKALRVQYQGDRLQGLVHLPKDDEAAIAMAAVEIAAALQATFECAIKHHLPEAEPLHLAIGVAMGRTLVSKLGTHAHRDRICLGKAVQKAAALEEKAEGEQTAISSMVHAALPDDVACLFEWSASVGGYVATRLQTSALDAVRRARTYDEAKAVAVERTPLGSNVIKTPALATAASCIVIPSRPFASEFDLDE